MADYSHTDRKQLMKVVTRYMPGDDAGLSVAQTYAKMEADDIKESSKPQTRKRRVYIFKLVEVIEGS